jgi:hypothetical protein
MHRTIWMLGLAIGMSASLPASGQDDKPADKPADAAFTGKVGERLPGPFRSMVVHAAKPVPVEKDKDAPVRVLSDTEINRLDQGREQKPHCLVNRNGINPCVAVFSRAIPDKADDPLAVLLTKLEPLIEKHKVFKFGSFCIFLTLSDEFLKDDTRVDQMAQINKFATEAKLDKVVLAIDPKVSAQTKLYAIPDDAQVVVYVYNRMQIKGTWIAKADKALSEEDIKAIVAAVDNEMPKPTKKK